MCNFRTIIDLTFEKSYKMCGDRTPDRESAVRVSTSAESLTDLCAWALFILIRHRTIVWESGPVLRPERVRGGLRGHHTQLLRHQTPP